MSDLNSELKESLAFALESGKMGTWDINLEKNTIQCSSEMLTLWGVTEKVINGDRSILQSRVHPEDFPKMVAAINDAIKNKSIYELEYRIFPMNAPMRWVLSRGRHTFSSDKTNPVRFAGVVYDITDKKLKEESLAAAEKSRDQFFMIASHELRTPLTCLSLQLEVLEWVIKNEHSQTLADNRIETGLNKQKEHINRIARIVDNILYEAKTSQNKLALQKVMFELTGMVKDVISQFNLAAQSAGVSITLVRSEIVHGEWDRFRLEQVLLNLMMNALKYGNKSPIQIEVKKENDHAFIIVRDNGIGINEEDQRRIFERFERATPGNNITGMGLGLYIADTIVRAHQGEIKLKSSTGEGSEFTVVLPQIT